MLNPERSLPQMHVCTGHFAAEVCALSNPPKEPEPRTQEMRTVFARFRSLKNAFHVLFLKLLSN